MGIGSMKGGLHPLIRGGGTSSQRPPGAPSLKGPLPANPAFFFEDFWNIDFASSGNPSWLVSNVTGTGSVRCAGGTPTSGGTLLVSSGATSGNLTQVSSNALASVGSGGFGPGSSAGNVAVRFAVASSGNANARQGILFVSNTALAVGQNWVTAPATALAGQSYIAAVRDSGVTPSGGAAGDWALYYGDSAVTPGVLLLGTPGGNTPHKLELSLAANGGAIDVYFDGVLKGSIAYTSAEFANFRLEAAAMTLTAAARSISVDYVYQEVGLTAAR